MNTNTRRTPRNQHHPRRLPTLWLALGLAMGGAGINTAWADGGRGMPTDMPKAYVQECAACHTAYPPGMLSARSWQRIMAGLDQHYGTDAALDAATVQQLAGWLKAHAGTYKRVAEDPPEDRITRSAWFVRKHREIAPAVWQLPSVKTAANCAACHTDTEQGRYSDHLLRLPAGLTPRQQQAWHD
jgi:hypothetical protein